ncbi:FET Ferroxidase [Teratosphaeria nubilosa]|uniref:FET Ferroxidase n=1 Tax=Teratosphaeria nubilosa TaxID=161662 RepID=A0A6G1L466_9PEZI|nr:FET Ferroxidase [Teratosphaeria nubilosa]
MASPFLKPLGAVVACLAAMTSAATVTYDWNVTWVRANPDGMAERPTIGVNGQWPWPLLNITKGDRVVVNLHNQLGNETTSLHFHGLFQNGTNYMDGPVGVTQCDVPPGETMVYNFTIDQPGTYWYHSHSRSQYPDGFRGQYIIHDPENPYRGHFDAEIPLTVSDWYHDEMPGLLQSFISYKNPTGAEPVPKSALLNDTQNLTIPIETGKTYFFRLTNIGAFAGQYFWIEGHNMTIIEVDGVYTEPAEADMIYLTAAQRYGFLLTAKNSSSTNFPIMASMDTDLFDTLPGDLNWNVTGWLVYDQNAAKPAAAEVDSFTPFDDFTLVSQDGLEVYGDADVTITLDLTMNNLGDGANYAFFNNITYVTPVVPTLYSALSTGATATNHLVYGDYTDAYVLEKGQIVDIVLNNDDTGKHPFHLHGHNFQAIVRTEENGGHWNPENETDYPAVPMRRDTLMVRPLSNFVIRFVADNPGVWLFHCHIDWHLASGLAATMIEAPLEMQKTLTIPQNHLDVCMASGTKTSGNAAGNTLDVLNLEGQNESPAPLPSGFTARGILALVFSCISALLGLAAIAWYGAAPLSAIELAAAERFVQKHDSRENAE